MNPPHRRIDRVSPLAWLAVLISMLKARDSCLIVGAFMAAGLVSGQAGQFGDYTFASSGSEVTIISYTGPGGDVIIPSTIDDLPVTGIEDLAFWGCTNLTSVTIHDSITSISWWAFYGCTGLTSVTIPDSVTSIGGGAFQGCTGLTAITVDALNPFYSSLDGVVFNKSQTTVIMFPEGRAGTYPIPDSVTSIGPGAFYGCGGLTSVTIPNSVTEIGGSAFAGCTRLTHIALPERVVIIVPNTFRDCVSLVDVTIPSGVESIGSAAFAGCISLTHVTIPESVTYFGTNRVGGVETFRGCTRLTAIHVNSQNPVYSSLNGVLLDKAQATIILYPGGKQGAYSAPGSVASIGPMAFNGCAGLTCITIPDSVTTIGYSAFSGCINLSSAMISESVIAIGHWAFHDCANLTRVYCGGAAPTFGAGVFYGATNTTVHFLPATTGWATMFGERPTALWVPIMLTLPSVPGDYMLKLITHSPAPATVRVQRSVNLVDWEDWQTVSGDEGPSELQDSDAGTTPYRFYRGIEE